MAVTKSTSATLTASATGSEDVLTTLTNPAVFVLSLDTANMVGGSTPNIIFVKEYGKSSSGDTERLLKTYTLIGSQSEPLFQTVPRVSPHHIKYSLKQSSQTTSITFPWAVYQVST